MIPDPIAKVLSSFRTNRVQFLLMGGQACIMYGAAEFSRDVDFVIPADAENLGRVGSAMRDLRAAVIAVPPFEARFLERGLAVHFRSGHPESLDMRIDLMSKLRESDDFPELWKRRTTLEFGGEPCDLLGRKDLVRAKKTQRDKDWPMLTRLVEVDYFAGRGNPTPPRLDFWFGELRTPELLLELAGNLPDECRDFAVRRRLLEHALAGDEAQLRVALKAEENAEKERDREFWKPLRRELERLRLERDRGDNSAVPPLPAP